MVKDMIQEEHLFENMDKSVDTENPWFFCALTNLRCN